MSNIVLKPIVSDLREIIIKGVAALIITETENQSAIAVCLRKIPQNTKEEQISYIYTTSNNILHRMLISYLFTQRNLMLSDKIVTKLSSYWTTKDCNLFAFDSKIQIKIEKILKKIEKSQLEQDDFMAWVHQYWIDTSVYELSAAEKNQHTSYENQMFYEVLLRLDQEQTQFGEYYTPLWTVKYIVDHSIEYYQSNCKCKVEQIKLYDPACGTGNFLVYAFDAFLSIYQREHSDWPISQIVTTILNKNLFGTDIKEDALKIVGLNLCLKAIKTVGPLNTEECNTEECNAEECEGLLTLFMELIQQNVVTADFLLKGENEKKFDILVMNPPFVDTRNMPEDMKAFMQTYYKKNARNLVAAFVERALQRTKECSVIGLVASDTFKTLVSFRHLRKTLLETTRIRSMVELGFGVFDADVSCGIYFFDRMLETTEKTTEKVHEIHYLDARRVSKKLSVSEVLKQLELEEKNAYHKKQSVFSSYRDYRFLTDLPYVMSQLYAEKKCLGLGMNPIAQCRVGLQIGEHEERFTKHVWDVPEKLLANKTYVRISKSNRASFLRDYYDILLWNQDGEWIKSNPGGMLKNTEYYFKRGLSYNLGGRIFKVRKLPETVLFTQGSSGIFLNPGYEELEDYLLGVLKSKAVNYFLLQINPTNNTTPNDVKQIPIVLEQKERMQVIAQISCEIQRAYLDKMQYDSISEYYKGNAFERFWCGNVEDTCTRYLDYINQTELRILKLKNDLDEQVYQLYGVTKEEQLMIEEEFRREKGEIAGYDFDARKSVLTNTEKKKLILLDFVRMIAKKIMLGEAPKIYDRFELEQRIQMEILRFYGKGILEEMEHLLGVSFADFYVKGIQIGSRKAYLSGNGSNDLTEPYLRSKLIAKQGGNRECVFWHQSQFLIEYDEIAYRTMKKEFIRIAEEVYFNKFLATKSVLYEKCILGLRWDEGN